MRTARIAKLGIIFGIMAFAFGAGSARTASASATRQIVNTIWNVYGPEGREVEIKNVDVVEYQVSNMNAQLTYYELEAYLWVKRDLGVQTDEIQLIDHLAPRQLSLMPIQKVGTDATNGYYVYMARWRVAKSFRVQFYASILVDGETHFSNERYPDRFFEVSGTF